MRANLASRMLVSIMCHLWIWIFVPVIQRHARCGQGSRRFSKWTCMISGRRCRRVLSEHRFSLTRKDGLLVERVS